MELMTKQGYKQTKVGLIPEDWKLESTVEVAKNKTGGIKIGPFGSALKKELLTKQGYKVYGQENVFDNDVEIGDRYINKQHFQKLKSCKLNPGDFIVSMMGTIGQCMILPDNIQPGIMDSHLLRIKLDEKKVYPHYFEHIFSSVYTLNQIKKLSVGGIMDGLSSKIVKQILYNLPPTLTEQKAIATALSDVDELITNLGKLITKKKAIKQGAMQQLLTGETRIKGYDNNIKTVDSIYGKIPIDWGIQSIGNVCKIFGRIGFRGYTVNDIVDEASGALSLSPSNIINNKINFKKGTFISWMKYHESPEIKIRKGDIVLVKTASVGKTAIIENLPHKITLNPQLVVLKNVKIDRYYLSYMMSYKIIQNQIITSVAGGVVPTLTQEQISGFTFPIPNSIQEQKAISNTLSDMDTEITQLESKKEKYQAIKQGMMQELLTGKTRLI